MKTFIKWIIKIIIIGTIGWIVSVALRLLLDKRKTNKKNITSIINIIKSDIKTVKNLATKRYNRIKQK